MSKVAIIGYGNVGYHLANRISTKRHEVTVFSRRQTEDFILSLDQLATLLIRVKIADNVKLLRPCH
ncbi:MAG: NAD(P)-binding domain-containing protein, partial [Bacteroidota bacterium]